MAKDLYEVLGVSRDATDDENVSEQLTGVSVVACRYGIGSDGGIVAVIGPTRMDYTKALAAVRIASKTLGE